MDIKRQNPFIPEKIVLKGTFFVERAYTQNHAHAFHAHEHLELLYIFDGEGRYQVGSRKYAVRAGDMVVCNASVLHGETLAWKNTIQTYCIALSGIQLSALPFNNLLSAEEHPIVPLKRFREISDLLMPNIHTLFQQGDYPLARQLAVSMLMIVWQELQARQQDGSQRFAQRNETLVREITQYLDAHYTEQVRMEEICREFHLSVSYLSHMFKKETGLSPKQYLMLRRIGEAQSMLSEGDAPIGQIEEQLGFTSSCHLASTFKKYVGISPREYRRHFREMENEPGNERE